MKQKLLTRTWVVAALAFICCVLWGSAITTIKIGYELMAVDSSDTASQIVFAGLRFTMAGILVVLFACIKEKRVILPTKNIVKLAFPLCLAQTVGQYFFFYVGVAHTSGVKSSIITGLGNFIAILMSCLLFRKEKMTGRKAAGCVLGFAGVLVINLMGNQLDMGFQLIGEGSLLLAQIAYALSTVLINTFSRLESPVVLSGYQFFLGGLLLTAVGVGMGGRLNRISVAAAGVLLYLALVQCDPFGAGAGGNGAGVQSGKPDRAGIGLRWDLCRKQAGETSRNATSRDAASGGATSRGATRMAESRRR